jgi:hypothetical protein
LPDPCEAPEPVAPPVPETPVVLTPAPVLVVSVLPSPWPPVVGVVVDDDVLVVSPSPCPPVVLVFGSVVLVVSLGVVLLVVVWVKVCVDVVVVVVDVEVDVCVLWGWVFLGVVATWTGQSLLASDWIVVAPWSRLAISVEFTPLSAEIWLWSWLTARCAPLQSLLESDCSRLFSCSVSRAAWD